MIHLVLTLLCSSLVLAAASSSSSSPTIRFVDNTTKITPLSTLHIGHETLVYVDGWSFRKLLSEAEDSLTSSTTTNGVQNVSSTTNESRSTIFYTTYVDDKAVSNGTVTSSLSLQGRYMDGGDDGLFCGSFVPSKNGQTSVRVVFQQSSTTNLQQQDDDETNIVQTQIRSYHSWMIIIPVVIPWVLFLVIRMKMEYSLLLGVFAGSWIVKGSFLTGFSSVFDTYLLSAVTDPSHVALIMFSIFMATFAMLVAVSGGSKQMSDVLATNQTKTKIAQLTCFVAGIYFFFDPYASIVLMGNIIGPLVKVFPVSAEKFALIVDSTALPVATIVPVSTHMTGVSNMLVQEINDEDEEELQDIDAKTVLIKSLKYQFFPILLLTLTLALIISGRDAGRMLKVEKENWTHFLDNGAVRAKKDQEAENPSRIWNWWIPMVVITVLIWVSFGQMDENNPSGDVALSMSTWMTAAGASVVVVQLLFVFQTKRGEAIGCCGFHHGSGSERPDLTFLTETYPSTSTSKSEGIEEHEEDNNKSEPEGPHQAPDSDFDPAPTTKDGPKEKTYSLLSLRRSFDCYIVSTRKSIPLAFALVSCWAATSVYSDLGLDRIVTGWVLHEDINVEVLPIVTFFSSFLLAMTSGSSYSTIATIVSALTVPVVEKNGGSEDAFAAFLGSLISGSVAGCFCGPFTETTILSSFSAESNVREHFLSKLPYAMTALIAGSAVGTVPVSLGAYPDFAGLLVGIGIVVLFVVLCCRRIKSVAIKSPNAGEAITQSRFLFGSKTDMKDDTKVHSLQSFKEKMKDVAEGDGDPITELVEVGLINRERSAMSGSTATPILQNRTATRERSSMSGSTAATPVVHNLTTSQSRLKSQQLLMTATIRQSESEGNVFSPSLRNYLRTAETKLDKMIEATAEREDNSLEIDGSESGDESHTDESRTDDELDNLMMNIASRGWSSVKEMTRVATSVDEDGNSTLNGDSYTSTTSHSAGHGDSTAYTGVTSYTGEDDDDDDEEEDEDEETASLPSHLHSVESSIVHKVTTDRKKKRNGGGSSFLNNTISSEGDDSTVEASKASF